MLAMLNFTDWLVEWMNEENISRYFNSIARTYFTILVIVPFEVMMNFIYHSGFHDMTLSDPFLWIIRRMFRAIGKEELYSERREAIYVIWDFSRNLQYQLKFTLCEYQYYPRFNDRVILTIRF